MEADLGIIETDHEIGMASDGGAGGAAAAEPEPQVAPIDDEMLCTLCYDRPKDHVIMPCCHRICERCGQNHIEVATNAGQDATCPFCRGVVWRIGILRD